MAVDASIVNGDITNSAYKTQAQRKAEENTVNNDLDKQAFLKLLVAQMKYQDPMEPTDNTEYVSQLAQFSSLEAMNNVSQSVDLQRATGLIGKVVTVAKEDAVTGVSTEKTGTVDFVSQSGSKTYLTVDGEQYELDEVSKIWDDTYAKAYTITNSWSNSLANLPNASFITNNNKDAYQTQVSSLYASFMSMDEYSQSFVSDEDKVKLADLVNQYRILGVDIANGITTAAETGTSGDAGDDEVEEIIEAITTDTDTDDEVDETAQAAAAESAIETEEDS